MAETLNPNLVPENVKTALRKGLVDFDLDDALRNLLLNAAEGKVGQRLKVYPLSRADAKDKKALKDLGSFGWRIAVKTEDNSAIAADVYTKDLIEPRVACVRRGPHVVKMLEAVEAEINGGRTQLRDRELGLRLIVSPALFTQALWSEHAGTVRPFQTLVTTISVEDRLDAADFLGRVSDLANQLLKIKGPQG